MISKLIEDAQVYLPDYLTSNEKVDLYAGLRSFPDNFNYYSFMPDNKMWMQGDTWKGFVVINYQTARRKKVSGIILSNTCDVYREHHLPPNTNIIFSPIINLDKYLQMLRGAGKTTSQVNSLAQAIRKQRVTYIFHLPRIANKLTESIALLDDIHVQPLNDFIENNKSMRFRLSQQGHYIFLIKLSMHFTRLYEGTGRS